MSWVSVFEGVRRAELSLFCMLCNHKTQGWILKGIATDGKNPKYSDLIFAGSRERLLIAVTVLYQRS